MLEHALRQVQRDLPVWTLPDGEQVAECLTTRPNLPDLVVLDRSMPGMDGFEVLRQIRGELNMGSLPVLMLSGSDDHDHIAHARRVGADGYLIKPAEEAGWRPLASRLHSWTATESWRAASTEIVRVSCVPGAVGVPSVDRSLGSMTTAPRSADQKLVEFTAACDFAGITVARCLNLRQTDKVLDAKRRLVVRWLLSMPKPLPWGELEVRDMVDFSSRYIQERRAENAAEPLRLCVSRALALE